MDMAAGQSRSGTPAFGDLSVPKPTVDRSFASAILPIRLWLRFCVRRRWPWWVVCVGVEAFFAVLFVLILAGAALVSNWLHI